MGGVLFHVIFTHRPRMTEVASPVTSQTAIARIKSVIEGLTLLIKYSGTKVINALHSYLKSIGQNLPYSLTKGGRGSVIFLMCLKGEMNWI